MLTAVSGPFRTLTTFFKRFLLLLLLAMLLVPVIQSRFHFSKEAGLAGMVPVLRHPRLTWDGLLDNSFQPALEKYVNEKIGFRPYLIRLRNQLSFWLFKVARTGDALIGEHNVLFQPGPIESYLGHDLLAKDEICFRVRRLQVIQKDLSQRGVQLLFVLAPSKARFEPENLPSHLRPAPGTVTNYDLFTREMRADSIALLNLVPVFAHWKSTQPYQLFPRGGAHWSIYGATLAADTLLRRLEQLGGMHFPSISTLGPPRVVRALDSLSEIDNDLNWLLNLIERPESTPLAYRQLAFAPPKSGQVRPSALFVGDSFTWGHRLFNPYIQREFSADTRFWYYNSTVFQPDSIYHATGEKVGNLDLRQQLESRQFVILLLTEHNLVENEFGFTEQVYRLYHPLTATDQAAIDQLARKLANQAPWQEQTKDPEAFAQRIRQQALHQYERQQLR